MTHPATFETFLKVLKPSRKGNDMPFTIMEKEGKKPPKHGGFLFSTVSKAAPPIANKPNGGGDVLSAHVQRQTKQD
jgi:hypothetical protein